MIKTKTVIALSLMLFMSLPVNAESSKLQELINQAIRNNPEILAAEARVSAAEYRVPQAKALPDPQITLGYQDDTFDKFTLGEQELSWIAIQGSQTLPFFGKRKLRAQVASHEAMAQRMQVEGLKLKTASQVKQLYYDLFLAYKNLDIIKERTDLFKKAESAALSRYSTGIGQQQDVLLAQTEKYNLLTQEEEWHKRIRTDESQLNALLGRDASIIIEKPEELIATPFTYTLDQLTQIAYKKSPELMVRQTSVAQQSALVKLAKREAYPDFTINGGVFPRGGDFSTMWMLSTTFTLPVYYFQKQKYAIKEAQATSVEMSNSVDVARVELSSSVRENYLTVTAADRLIRLYKTGLISRTMQDYELALIGYVTGKNDALSVINSLKNLIDYETSYWEQFVEREKAIANIEALIAVDFSNTVQPPGISVSPRK